MLSRTGDEDCGVAVSEQARHVFANVGRFYVAMESSWEHVSMSVFYHMREWGRYWYSAFFGSFTMNKKIVVLVDSDDIMGAYLCYFASA